MTVCVPAGTNLTNLVACFSTTADKVCIGETEQTSGSTANDFSSVVTYTLWKNKKYNNIKIKVYDFPLPVMWIETPGNAKITSKNTWMEGATAKLYSSGTLTPLGVTQIKGRGNTTWGYPKNPYTIKLDKKAAILGMPKDKRWNLLANWMDRTDMRNDVALQLARVSPGLDWTSRGKFVELIMNGKHVGNYYLCEHIKIAEDRVNITAIDEDAAKAGDPVDLTGGYLMEFDTYFDEANKFRSSLNLPVNLKDPDWTTGFSKTYIQNWINGLEGKLTAVDISGTDYKDYLDIDSYIDWWFVHEMAKNGEPNHPKSSYMYKDKETATDNKIHAGPCWDFDWGTFTPSTSWNVKNAIWYSYLFKDPAFVARVKEKWNAQKAAYDAVASTYIDAVATEIKESVAADKTLWPCTSTVNGDKDLSFDDAVARLKSSLQAKIAWMDSQINSW